MVRNIARAVVQENITFWLFPDLPRGESERPLTGWPEAVTRLRLPQNVACGFPALRSSERVSQHSECLELPVWKSQAWSLQRPPHLYKARVPASMLDKAE